MIQQMLDFISYFFGSATFLGIGLALVFGAIWLACYRPPLFSKPWLWAVLAGSVILMPVAVAFAEIPLKTWIERPYYHFWSQETISQWLLLVNLPALFVNGLVKEGAKLLPVVIYWWRNGRNITPKLGLAIGALAGAGFGVLWAQWLYNFTFASGWTWHAAQTHGIQGLAPFLEGFFLVGFHTASCALAGYGLAKGRRWQFYLLASLLHTVLNYSYLLQYSELLSNFQALLMIGALAFLVTGVALWLRERKLTSVVGI